MKGTREEIQDEVVGHRFEDMSTLTPGAMVTPLQAESYHAERVLYA
jgi:hypothetical protein